MWISVSLYLIVDVFLVGPFRIDGRLNESKKLRSRIINVGKGIGLGAVRNTPRTSRKLAMRLVRNGSYVAGEVTVISD
jgi:hypothetical protein